MMGRAADVIRVGCQFEAYDGRIDQVFKMPNEQVAEARLFWRYETFLTARLYNQTHFCLPATVASALETSSHHEDDTEGAGDDNNHDPSDHNDNNQDDD